MSIIYSYPKISSLNGKDSFVVTDNSDNNKTKTVAWEDVLKDNNLIQNIKVTLTPEQILNLHTTPVDLIPAPGPGKIINLINLISHYEFNTTPYTVSSASQVRVKFEGQTVNNVTVLASRGTLQSTIDCYGAANNWPNFPFEVNTTSLLPNAAIQASVPETAPVTLGDSSIHVYLSYTIKDL
jgi:hypothetical protein|tara:strand:- start:212 stop:757 length:546 start_codon:yes stop_codon:yes gene_type:complete